MNDCKIFDQDSYKMICRLREASDGLSFFPDTSKVILQSRKQTKLFKNFEHKLIPGIAEDLGIRQEAAFHKTRDFFNNSVIRV